MQITLTPEQLAEVEAARAGGATSITVEADVDGGEAMRMGFGLPVGEVTSLTITIEPA